MIRDLAMRVRRSSAAAAYKFERKSLDEHSKIIFIGADS